MNKIITTPFFFLLTLILLFSCDKNSLDYGLDLLQQDDLIGAYVDSTSVSVTMKTEYEDTLRSTKITYMLGSIENEEIGNTRADFMTRFYLKDLATPLQNCTLDSVCFVMYERPQFVGDTMVEQTIKIFELTEDLTPDHCKNYTENLQIPFDLINSASLIGEKSFKPRTDTTSYFRYKLPSTNAQTLYTKIKSVYSQTKDLQSVDSMIIRKFKGLYITSDFENAAIVNFAPQIQMYVHSADSSYMITMLPSATSYAIEADSDPSHVYLQELNMFHHDYINSIKENIGEETNLSYVEGFTGLRTDINLSGLDAWQDSAVVFNAVKLYIPYYQIAQKRYYSDKLPKIQVYNPEGEIIASVESTKSTDSTELEFNLNGFMTYVKNNSYKASEYIFKIACTESNVYGNIYALDATLTNKIRLKILYSK